ncbi:hypothetical protein [Streptomyces sp. NPDC059262]|uniref:hypothetical protein n=1 Tax=Streptomyces sp. NPDC059262 TaxID=3346797 RepID=UPI0036829B3B
MLPVPSAESAVAAAFSLTACRSGGKDAVSGSETSVSESVSSSTGDGGTPSGAKSGTGKAGAARGPKCPPCTTPAATVEANQHDAGLDANGV